jgi:hypothetical protein
LKLNPDSTYEYRDDVGRNKKGSYLHKEDSLLLKIADNVWQTFRIKEIRKDSLFLNLEWAKVFSFSDDTITLLTGHDTKVVMKRK